MTTTRFSTLAASLFAFAALSSSARAGVRYVDANLSTGANDGTSWSNAFRGSSGLSAALTAAVGGDEIWVADGTYLPSAVGARTDTFLMKSCVIVLGGFAGGETQRTQRDAAVNVAVLSGDLAGNDAGGAYGDNSYHVVTFDGVGSDCTQLDGFHVVGGNANGIGESAIGGGVYFENSSAFLVRCTLRDNRAIDGAAIGMAIGADPVVLDCVVRDNVASGNGGAVSFAATTSVYGRFERCRFTQNTAQRGGAIDFPGATGGVYFTHCSFDQNLATGNFQAASIWVGTGASLQMRNCTVAGNLAPASPYAGLVATSGASFVACLNCVFSGNVASGSTAQPAQVLGSSGTFVLQTSCVTGQLFPGPGNLDLDPAFVDAAHGDFRLSAGSPVVDRGNDFSAVVGSNVPSMGDVNLRPRFVDDPAVASAARVDMGAYERQLSTATYFCFGDRTHGDCRCGYAAETGSLRGCRNAMGAGGLEPDGVASLSADTLLLRATQATGPALLFFQGTTRLNGGGGVVFGDGLRCAGGLTTRLAQKNLVGGAAQYPNPGDAPISVAGQVVSAGTTRTYQGWYRSALPHLCPPVSSNLTNGIEIVWAP